MYILRGVCGNGSNYKYCHLYLRNQTLIIFINRPESRGLPPLSGRYRNKEITVAIINCTPHTINIEVDSDRLSIKASGILPRIETISTPQGEIEGIPTVSVERGEIEGLPIPKKGDIFLVSAMVFWETNRLDVVAPDTGDTAIRENGHTVAVRNLLVHR